MARIEHFAVGAVDLERHRASGGIRAGRFRGHRGRGQFLRCRLAADGGDVFREHVFRGRKGLVLGLFHLMRVARRNWRDGQSHDRRRMLLAEVAGVAADARLTVEILLVEVEDHADHLARGLLLGLGVAGEIETLRLLVEDVAEVAVHAERCGDVVHGQPELGVGEIGQQLNVLLLGAGRGGREQSDGDDEFAHVVSFDCAAEDNATADAAAGVVHYVTTWPIRLSGEFPSRRC